jgi:hypothetical protein
VNNGVVARIELVRGRRMLFGEQRGSVRVVGLEQRPFSYIISTGNEADLDFTDFARGSLPALSKALSRPINFSKWQSSQQSAASRSSSSKSVEAALDGLYVVRTSLPATALDDTATVRSYKSLSLVERAFRCIKTVDLQIRPVYHWLADRVRAHVFVCMLAYYLEWHLRPATGCSSSFRASSTRCAARSDGSVAWPSATGEPADGRIDFRIGSKH